MSNNKGTVQLVFGTIVDYNKVLHLKPGEYVQVHQEDEPWSTIDIDQTVGDFFKVLNKNFRVAISLIYSWQENAYEAHIGPL